MLDWVLATVFTTTVFAVALWLMARYFRRQTDAVFERTRREATRMADESIARSQALATPNPPLSVTLTLDLDGTPNDPDRMRSKLEAALAQLADQGITVRTKLYSALRDVKPFTTS